jgi:hypothetical protein
MLKHGQRMRLAEHARRLAAEVLPAQHDLLVAAIDTRLEHHDLASGVAVAVPLAARTIGCIRRRPGHDHQHQRHGADSPPRHHKGLHLWANG